MTSNGESGRVFGMADPYEDGPDDPRSLEWRYDPANYLDDPERGEADLAIWLAVNQAAADAAEEVQAEANEPSKSAKHIESEDIAAVYKSISRSAAESQPGPQLRLELSSDLGPWVAWGSAMHSSQVEKAKLVDLTTEDLARVSEYNLRRALFGKGPQTFADEVAFNADESRRIFHGPRVLAKRAHDTTYAAGAMRPSHDERLAAADRSIEHAFESTSKPIEGLLSGIEKEKTWLAELKWIVGNFRFRLVDEASMMLLRAAGRGLSFNNMLDVAGLQQKWNGAQLAAAHRALDARLFHGPQHVKTRYWNQLVDLAIEYANTRADMLQGNLHWARQRMLPAS